MCEIPDAYKEFIYEINWMCIKLEKKKHSEVEQVSRVAAEIPLSGEKKAKQINGVLIHAFLQMEGWKSKHGDSQRNV